MDLIIQSLDGTIYDTKDYELRVLDFVVGTPSMRTNREFIDGRDGFIHQNTDFGKRKIKASFQMISLDAYDTILLRHDIFKLMIDRQQFYVIDSREHRKRWLAQLDKEFDFGQISSTIGIFDIELVAQPYSESIGTTQDPFTFDSELWGLGMNLPADKELEYTHTTSTFDIYNASDKIMDPREDSIKITYTNDGSAFTGLTITNTTNGDKWEYTGTVNAGDVILLEGVRSLKNDVSIVSNTNLGTISLDKGVNTFNISGSTSHTISFDFRFKYL